jgi:hypothetical protein
VSGPKDARIFKNGANFIASLIFLTVLSQEPFPVLVFLCKSCDSFIPSIDIRNKLYPAQILKKPFVTGGHK